MTLLPSLQDSHVLLERASTANVEQLVDWTLDPIAQGPHKRVPALSRDELKAQFLAGTDRSYFLMRRLADAAPLGRLYWRAWRFPGFTDERVDWELNILIAMPAERGKGYGSAAQRLAAVHLDAKGETRSVFAFTLEDNVGEQRALTKAGFVKQGPMPNERYPVALPAEPCVLYVWPRESTR